MLLICPHCGSSKVRRRGLVRREKETGVRLECTDKNHPKGVPRYFYQEKAVAKVLLFDIETLPMEVYAWRLGEQNWNPDNIIRDWCVLGYSAKWLFDAKTMSNILTPKQALERDDKSLVDEIYLLLQQADVVIAHNGDHFDLPKMNTRFLRYNMRPPSPYQTVDTRDTAKRAFGFSSNKLDYLAKYLGLPAKLHTDFSLWVQCAKGEKESLDYMHQYNRQDIFVLEDVYVKLRPWIRHPNMSLYMDVGTESKVCPKCGSDDVDLGETYRTTASVFEAFRCNRCGSIGRMKTRQRTTAVRSIN